MEASRKAGLLVLQVVVMMAPLLLENGILLVGKNMAMLQPIPKILILYMLVKYQGIINELGKHKIFHPKRLEVANIVL